MSVIIKSLWISEGKALLPNIIMLPYKACLLKLTWRKKGILTTICFKMKTYTNIT